MKLAIMQPYFFPYIGYWQLIYAVDEFIILDDVNYINRGWINRNRIIRDNKEYYLINPIEQRSQNKYINELNFVNNSKSIKNMERTIQYSYRKAPYLDSSMKVISNILLFENRNVAAFLENEINVICDYLGIATKITRASTCRSEQHAHGQDGIISLCKNKNAGQYFNPIGGSKIYDKNKFKMEGIELSFLTTDYMTLKGKFNYENMDLSIIDLMMHFPSYDLKEMLDAYLLI